MSAPKWVGQAHAEAPGKVEKADALKTAELQIRKMVARTTRDRIAKVNSDGLETKPTTPAIIGAKVSPILGNGVVTMPGADRSRETAKPFSSGANDTPFHAMADLPQGTHPNAIPLLEQHGITVGVRAGVLVIQRKYVPAATGLLQTLAGGQ